MEQTKMNAAWKLGYADRMTSKDRAYQPGPVAIVGIVAFDYSSGYAAANRDLVWKNNNRPPLI
jgi:hypothetical protein